MHNDRPDNSTRFQEMAMRQMKFNKLLKKIALISCGVIALTLMVGFIFFGDTPAEADKVAVADENTQDKTTVSESLKTAAKPKEEKEGPDLDVKRFSLEMFDFSDSPVIKDLENSIEYLFVNDEDSIKGTVGYSPAMDNSSPYRIVSAGLPGKTLEGSAASCYSDVKTEDLELPVDDTPSSNKDMIYRVLLPETKEVEEAMRLEVDRVVTGLAEYIRAGGSLESYSGAVSSANKKRNTHNNIGKNTDFRYPEKEDNKEQEKNELPAEPAEKTSGEQKEDHNQPMGQDISYDGEMTPAVIRIAVKQKEVDYVTPDTNPPESHPPNRA